MRSGRNSQLYKVYNLNYQAMSSEESVEFDLNEFYDILTSINIKEKLKPFVRQFKKKNLPFIYETMVNIIQVFNSKKEMPLMKFNALMATKLFFDTGEYIPIVLIEIYLLPIIFEVAVYRIQKRSEEGLTLYFIEKGYDTTKQMKRIGFNYVLLALQFIFMSAQIKPHRNLEKFELKEKSSYAKFAKTLLEKGVQPIQTYKFYLPSYVTQSRKRYIKKLSKFNPEQYIDFFVRMVCEEVNLNKKPQINLKKMMSYGDAFLNIPIMNICEEQLDQMETNFINKKKYLNLLGEFMRAGDIYAVLIITRSSFLQSIFQKVKTVKGQIGLDVGEKIYPEVQASKLDKRQFYIQFLKHVEIWASCHPVDQDGEPTTAKKIFDILKLQKRFVFPPNILLNKIKKEMEINLKQNQQRNQQIIKLVDEGSAYESRRKNNVSSMKQSRGSRKSAKQTRSNIVGSYIQFDQIQEMVVKAKKKLDLIIQKEKLPQTIAFLQKFKKFWQAISQKNQIDLDESADIQIVLEQGTLCAKIVELILPVYTLLKKKVIDFDQYISRVGLLMKSEQLGQQSGEASIEKDMAEESGEQIQTIKQQSQQNKSSYMANIRGSSLMQSKQASRNSPQLESKVSSEQNIKLHGVSKLKPKIFNDYELPIYKNAKADQKPNASKQSSQVKEQFQSSKSNLRSSRNSRDSRRIIQRRTAKNKIDSLLKSQDEEQLTYKDIINNKNKNLLPKQSYEQSKQSFISSDNSSIKQNQNNKSNSSFSNRNSGSISKRSSRFKKSSVIRKPVNAKDPTFDDYYGSLLKQQPMVQKPSNISQEFDQKPSKSSKMSKLKEKIQLQSMVSKSSIRNYNSGSFQILQSSLPIAKQSSLPNVKQSSLGNAKQSSLVNAKSKQIFKQKKQSRFTFTSKDVIEVESYEHIKDIPLSILSKYQKDSSIIQQPSVLPLVHSFHQFKEQSVTNPSKISSFKECFDINNEIISTKEGAQRIFKFSKTGKIINFVETLHSRQTPKNSTIFDMLSERNAKQSIEFYRNQKQKIRQAQTLSERVRSLESFNKNMRMKFIMKRQNQSRKIEEQRSPRSIKQPKVSNESQFVSFYPQSQTERQQSEKNFTIKPLGHSNDNYVKQQKMRTINTNIYKSYFPQQKSQKLKKCMLKSKGLILKNEEFEIGSVMNRRQNSIQYTIFITPLKDKVQEVNFQVNQDQNMNVKLYKKYQDVININQQYSLYFQISIDNVPYVLPTLSLKFKANRKYQHNQLLITIPCSFNKFFAFNKVSESFTQQFQNNNHDFIHISPFRYNTKILNPQKVSEYFNNFNVIPSVNKSNIQATEAYFKGKIFLLKLITNNRGTLQMQGKNMTGDHKNTKYLQFLMITLKHILQISKS